MVKFRTGNITAYGNILRNIDSGSAALSDEITLQCILVGILRGLQQVRSIAIVAFIAYIVINIPVGYLFAFIFDMGAPGLIVGYIVGLTTAAILYGVQVGRYMRYLRKIS